MSSALLAEPVEPRPELSLLMQRLPSADEARATAFLRLGKERLRCDWKVVDAGDPDVLLHGDDELATIPGSLEDPVVLLRVAEAEATPSARSGVLSRPLQYDDFIEALLRAEGAIMGPALAPPEAKPVPAEPAPRVAAAPAVAMPGFSLMRGGRYRLRRWPPSQLLLGHRYHSRLAGFLSVRHADVEELAHTSNVEVAECEAFLTALGRAGLLDVKAAPVTFVAAAAPVARVAPVEAGLFSKLRKRWGL